MHGRWGFGLVACWLWAAVAAAEPVASDKPAASEQAAPQTPTAQTPAAPTSALQTPAAQADTHRNRGTQHHHRRHTTYWSDSSWWGYPAPYGYYYPYYPAPLYLPAETLYGPQAMKRFLGLQDGPSEAAVSLFPSALAVIPARIAEEKKPPVPRAINPETRGLAWRFITFGDLHFMNEKFGEAYQRYRKAAEVVPELADAHFRQGFALVGSGRYEMAAKALKRGIALEPAWARSAFRLNDLYNANQRAKAAHVEALAAAAEKDPNNGDLMFLLGVCLFFDGQRDRAAPFFERAEQLAGQADHLQGFLEPLAKK